MKLVAPTIQYKDSYLAMVKEFIADSSEKRYEAIDKINFSEVANDFESYLEKLEKSSRGEHLPAERVPDSKFWLVDRGEVVGQVGIRHELNQHLLSIGGNIGYGIRPSKRRHGYGTKILELAINKAHELGVSQILITCDEDNIGSIKIIEKNGGQLENKVTDPETGILKRRYWIK